MGMKFVDVSVTYVSDYFDFEMSDEEIEEAKKLGIDVTDTDELVKYHLESNFAEHQDCLVIDDYEYDIADEEDN